MLSKKNIKLKKEKYVFLLYKMNWKGLKEKKWEWYKHTKPCNKVINKEICDNSNCNYAHTLDQYVDAILKRNFKLDFNVVNQLKLVDIDSNLMKMDIEETNTSHKRRYSSEEEPQAKKARNY